jgi:hypothetical protein
MKMWKTPSMKAYKQWAILTVPLAYKLQFLRFVHSSMYNIIWKAWAPLKIKNHAWIAYQNRF